MRTLEKTRSVSISLGELKDILGVKDDEILHVSTYKGIAAEVRTIDGREVINIERELVFTILTPVTKEEAGI